MQIIDFFIKNDSTPREACGWHDRWHLNVNTVSENVLGGIRGGMPKMNTISEIHEKMNIFTLQYISFIKLKKFFLY